MRFYFDLNLGKLVSLPGYSGLLSSAEFKRGDQAVLELQFCRGSVAQSLVGVVSEMVFVGKLDFLAGTEPLLLANDWTHDAINHIYSAPLGQSEDLTTVLGTLAFKDFLGELTFTTSGGGPSTSQTIVARVTNDVWKGTEGTPLDLPTPEAWLEAQRGILVRTAAQGAPVNAVLGVKASRSINVDNTAASSEGAVNWEVGSDLGFWSGTFTVLGGDTDTQAADRLVVAMNADAGLMVHYSVFRTGLLVVVEARVAAVLDINFYWALEGGYPYDAQLATGVAPVAGTLATYLGQYCRVGDASPYDWYHWDGTAWEFSHVEETTASVLALLQGWAEDPTRIGTEYLPDEFDGDKMFNGQVELGAQDPVTGTSALSRSMLGREMLFNLTTLRRFYTVTAYNTSGTGTAVAGGAHLFNLQGSVTASAWQRAAITNHMTTNPSWTGGISSAAVPMAWAIAHFIQVGIEPGTECRFVVGDTGSGAPPAFGANRLTGRGWGFVIYYHAARARPEIKLFCHNGTTYSETPDFSAILFAAYAPASQVHNTVISSDAAGNIKLFDGVSVGNGAGVRAGNTALLTLAGGPTDGVFGAGYVSAMIVNTASTVLAPAWRILDLAMQVGVPY